MKNEQPAGTAKIVPIYNEHDIICARQIAREIAIDLGFSCTNQAKIATAVSELARNIVMYAKKGELTCKVIKDANRTGIEIVARDDGPGIVNLNLALTDGHTTSHGLGIGLPGAKRLMGEMYVETDSGKGTRITARKWLNRQLAT